VIKMIKHSISGVKLFKACRRAYEFKYVEGLLPVSEPDALKTGRKYHELLENLYKNGNIIAETDEEDFSKEMAMAIAYRKHIFPKFKVKACEEWLEKGMFIGRADGIAEDGSLVEHKTTSGDLEEYEYDLQRDEQILMYMFLSGKRKVYYTIIKKPLLRQKKTETEEEFYWRMVHWYDEDTDDKIRVVELTRTDEEVNDFADELMRTAYEIDHCGIYYRNTQHCKLWGRRCEYAGICMNYDPHMQYTEFYRRKGYESTETG